MKKMPWVLSLFFSVALSAAAHATTLVDVKARGKLLCGVNPGLLGFAAKGADGAWAGFDVDFCKAVAAATDESGWARPRFSRAMRCLVPPRCCSGTPWPVVGW